MRTLRFAFATGLLLIASASAFAAEKRRAEVSEDFAAVLENGAITVEARPLEGETPIEFARRLTKDEPTSQQILSLPDGRTTARSVALPYALLSGETKRAAIAALFPSDLRATAGWLHIAVAEEELSAVAEWFTGSAANAAALMRENGLSDAPLSRGMTIRIPAELLLPPFRDTEAIGEAEPPNLTYGSDENGRYALYRLRKKEALYSAVVVRFTGRLHAPDVVELALKIAERSGIADVRTIPVGYPVKIQFEVLSEEFLPKDDPRAQERAREKAETAQFAVPVKARGLKGVRVILDAGHGGRDTGTLHDGLWESTYVYDVVCRLSKLLSERTFAEVVMTTRDMETGWSTPEKDRLENRKSRILLTSPAYDLGDPHVGVNLRWYLANAILRRPGAGKKKIPPERTVFLSIHADSLHPSVRGAMAYVPGERFLRERYGMRGATYQAFEEFRQQPVVSFSRRDRMMSEGVSTSLAEKLIASMQGKGLPIHRFSPVRTHVIRGGREWVPAVLRYNRVPNRVLLEIANLGNEEDRSLMVTKRFRQAVAESITDGLLEFFGDSKAIEAPVLAASLGGVADLASAGASSTVTVPPDPPPPELFGPWPELYGPWPDVKKARSAGTRSSAPPPKRKTARTSRKR